MNMHNNQDHIPQDTPEMRSVLIRSTPTAPGFQSGRLHQRQGPSNLFSKPSPAKSSPEKNYKWNPGTIPKLPEVYPLGRSRVTVSDCDGSEIASRIGEFLRQHSLSVKFTENTALCVTPCHANISVKIFEDENQYIVEVQRNTGCSFACQKYCRAILRAAKGCKGSVKQHNFTIPNSILSTAKEGQAKAIEEDFKKGLHLIKQDKHDSQLLGMSVLKSTTSKTKVTVEESSLNVLKKFISSCSTEVYSHDTESNLRVDALHVLANLLINRSIESSLIIDEALLKSLIVNLTHEDLHTAYQAARCLTSICLYCPSFKEKIAAFGEVADAAKHAEIIGAARHKELEREVKRLTKELAKF